MMSPVIGMIIALPSEAVRIIGRSGWRRNGRYACRRQTLPEGVELLIGLSGMGIENACNTARWLLKQGAAALVSIGVSGGLDPDLQPGELVIGKSVRLVDACRVLGTWPMPEDVVTQAAQQLATGKVSRRSGGILSLAEPVLSVEMKRKLGEEFRSLTVDMESAGVAMAAVESGISFFILRAVCDPLLQSVSPWFFDSLRADGSVRFQRLVGHILRRPAAMLELLLMQRRFRTACKALMVGWGLLCSSDFLPLLAGSFSQRSGSNQ